ncbi:hypothetical protein A2Z53_02255 [Candidatus Giovannonibacteria bacterium RIFCSPHIGHO2_02_42_15]|uniref:HicB-like antitoxin of toxin-antitoxin system domain-containing protein n=1 Tax=Candidatus Giovannonibacteria bacterium RIFCSPHIGHO2_02_42_15 TaxID=1798329 RepID=A0A1F5VN71_9BACT|nr:MAG: hypothetical protein A2Z53_02255 [Candidatus Giovannonibacteria bacterium RIFCSPHIGHO2_02_42_15]
MVYKSAAIITREGKWFVARSAELGVVSQGKNIEEAKKNLQEAIELYLEDMPKERKYLSKEAPFVTAVDISRG